MARFEMVYDGFRRGAMSAVDAAEALGMSERTFLRKRNSYDEDGLAGLVDGRLGRAAANAVPADRVAWVLDEYRTHHTDWTIRHFWDDLRERHNFEPGYTWTRNVLQDAGLVKRPPRRGRHRQRRPRKPCVGMMLHQDGSRHRWLDGQAPLDLVVTMDDATSAILSAFLVEEEGTMSTFRGLREVVAGHGLPCALYTDRGSHHFHTPKAGGAVDKGRRTQVGRALDQLGIEHIAAYSPEARGGGTGQLPRSDRTTTFACNTRCHNA